MSERLDFKAYPGFDPNEVRKLFENRGWYTRIISPEEAGLVKADLGAAVECIDGRFGDRLEKKKNGPKLPGGINAIMALHTRGDSAGFNEAVRILKEEGFNSGTHVDCGFYAKWKAGELKAARYPLVVPNTTINTLGRVGVWLERHMRLCDGKHFHIEGQHKEQGVIFNPYEELTVEARSDRFSCDHWLMKRFLNGKGREAKHLLAETVELLKPDAKKLEIVVV